MNVLQTCDIEDEKYKFTKYHYKRELKPEDLFNHF